MIDKRKGQVLSIMGEEVQIMDLDTYETFNLHMQDEYKDQIEAGQEIMYLEAMGRRIITRV
jgi:translation initiation factor 5A